MRATGVDIARMEVFGASVAGPRHRHLGEPNQDAWAPLRGQSFRGVAVADGLGSAPLGRLGARTACRAIALSLRTWAGTGAPPSTIGPLIESTWRVLLGHTPPRTARTTCLFGAVLADGEALTGQLGDGLATVVTGERCSQRGPGREGFGNETQALGTGAEWHIQRVPFSATSILLLATDGVADDLAPGSIQGFAQHLVQTYGPLPPRARWRQLATDLSNWPVPHHLDDKTVATLYVPR